VSQRSSPDAFFISVVIPARWQLLSGYQRPFRFQERYFPPKSKMGGQQRKGFFSQEEVFFPRNILLIREGFDLLSGERALMPESLIEGLCRQSKHEVGEVCWYGEAREGSVESPQILSFQSSAESWTSPFLDLHVEWNGQAFLFCGRHRCDLGSVYTHPIQALWQGQRAQRFRAEMLNLREHG